METYIYCPYCNEISDFDQLNMAMPQNNPNGIECWSCGEHFWVDIYVETKKEIENELDFKNISKI